MLELAVLGVMFAMTLAGVFIALLGEWESKRLSPLSVGLGLIGTAFCLGIIMSIFEGV